MRRLVIASLALAACSEEVSEVFPDGYQSWAYKKTVCGPAPGHGDSCRVIYANDIAITGALAPGELGYPEGSIFVKEIRANDDGAPGDLNYLALMRRQGYVDTALEEEGGWLFTQVEKAGETEVYRSLCWGRCHVAAPYNGAWYDYRAGSM